MYCRYCGKQLSDDSKFCRQCGKPVKKIPAKEPAEETQEAAPKKAAPKKEPVKRTAQQEQVQETAKKVAKALLHSIKANAAEKPGEFSYGTSEMDKKALNAAVKMLRGGK